MQENEDLNQEEELNAAEEFSEENVDETFEAEENSQDGEEELSEEQRELLLKRWNKLHEELPLKAQIEAIVFASPKPIRAAEMLPLITHDIEPQAIESVLSEIQAELAERQGGFRLESIKGLGYQMQTCEPAAPIMEKMFSSRPRPISRAAMETLCIIAYRQPCTRAAIEFIRGVDSGSIVKNLLERGLISCVGRKEVPGRPMLFGTTKEFLHVFNLSSLEELPSLESFQPTSETVQQALEELEQVDEVDTENFIADQDQEAPEVSSGLLDEGESFADESAEQQLSEDELQNLPPERMDSPEYNN